MARTNPPAIAFDDQEGGRLHGVWSRSGKHLIVTVFGQNKRTLWQVELRPDQVKQLSAFLRDSQPTTEPMQTTPAGNEIPVPTRDEFDEFVRKVAPPAGHKRPGETDRPRERSD